MRCFLGHRIEPSTRIIAGLGITVLTVLTVLALALLVPSTPASGQEVEDVQEPEVEIRIENRDIGVGRVAYQVSVIDVDNQVQVPVEGPVTMQAERVDGSLVMIPRQMVIEVDNPGRFFGELELPELGEWRVRFELLDPPAEVEDLLTIESVAPPGSTAPFLPTTVVDSVDLIRPTDAKNDLPSFLGVGLAVSVGACIVVVILFVRSRRRSAATQSAKVRKT